MFWSLGLGWISFNWLGMFVADPMLHRSVKDCLGLDWSELI